jgi:GNAT superfamily N-acetyltransferase
MSRAVVRFRSTIAKTSDLRLATRLCQRSVGRGDYALWVLRETIEDGGLFLAWAGHELVGMTNFERCVDGSGWLSMARTDPKWRRTGVALFLQRKIAQYAKRRHILFLRLWTLSNNNASKRVCLKGGFRLICEAAHISCVFRGKSRRKTHASLRAASKGILRSLLTSKTVSKTRGYLGYKWHFVRANKELLLKIARRGELYQDGETGFILTKPEQRFHARRSTLTLLSGRVGVSLLTAKRLAKDLGADSLSSYVPYDSYTLRTARKAGFKLDDWGKHCIVFEKRI